MPDYFIQYPNYKEKVLDLDALQELETTVSVSDEYYYFSRDQIVSEINWKAIETCKNNIRNIIADSFTVERHRDITERATIFQIRINIESELFKIIKEPLKKEINSLESRVKHWVNKNMWLTDEAIKQRKQIEKQENQLKDAKFSIIMLNGIYLASLILFLFLYFLK